MLLLVLVEVGLLGEPLAADGAVHSGALTAGELVPTELGHGELARAVGALFGPAVAGLVDAVVLLEDGPIAALAGDVLRLGPAFAALLAGKLGGWRGVHFIFCVGLLLLEPQDLLNKVLS